MKQLLLLRHGEAGFSQGLDIDRKLTLKGKEKLIRLGESLLKSGFSVDLMFCSSASRTQETAAIIKKYISIKEEVMTRKIYNADLKTLLELIEDTDELVGTCLLVGHNPTISLFLSHISNSNYIGMQPGMLARLELEVPHWRMIGHGTGTLREILQ
ncbi:MAG: phosphohistidine phosphatase [Algoriphagus sp.]|jgi:phosphohistidine phosphatase